MCKQNFDKTLDELSKPFHPSRITWRPGALTGTKDKALALAYADLRAYQNRLDETCGMDWSVSYTPWVDRIICHLTINGITRSSTGEADSDSERSEIAGTSAEQMAFTRACAMFGLGRYLYSLPSLWVEYDAPNQRFTEKSKARLHGIVAQHYQRWLDGQPVADLDTPAEQSQGETQGAEPFPPATDAVAVSPEIAQALAKLDELGVKLYGEQWPHVKAHNITRMVGDGGIGALTGTDVQTLITGLTRLMRQRNGAR